VSAVAGDEPHRVLIVDDDTGLRMLLRMTLESADLEVAEAENARVAEDRIAVRPPDVIVLDIRMPGVDGLSFCRGLKQTPETAGIGVVLLTADDAPETAEAAWAAGANAFLRKPFSPLELLDAVERLAGGGRAAPAVGLLLEEHADEQLGRYAVDLRRLLEIERGQRALLQRAYREAVTALATALESKDTGTKEHSQRVQHYACELARAVDPHLLDDPSLEYGFLLHDVGKIGIPDRILLKPGPLTASERRLMRTHTVLGEQLLGGVALLQGEGLRVVRSHHERWDGRGYPDGLADGEIALGARIFAVADALDAITSDRPYRRAADWHHAVDEIRRGAHGQFDPEVVEAFLEREPTLREIRRELAAA
jgi:response regulator RpfG family c-di-GMP phosphodiesterase